MRCFLAACVVFVSVPLASPVYATDPDPVETVEDLFKQGKYKSALEIIQTTLGKLPANAKLAKWTISLKQTEGYPCNTILIGKKYLYFTVSHPRNSKHGLGVPDARPVLSDSGGGFDHNTMITCVDGSTGKKIWTRRLAGGFKMAIDQKNDDLYCWRKSVFRLSAARGEVVSSKEIPKDKGWVTAIISDGHVYFDERKNVLGDNYPKEVVAFNVGTGAVEKSNIFMQYRISPDEKKYLALDLSQSSNKVATKIEAKRMDKGTLWSYEYSGYTSNEPFWHGDDVVALNGQNSGHAEVVRLEGTTGKLLWRFTMPRAAYCSGSDQLMGNAYQNSWNAIGMAGKFVLAIGGEATLYFLDPKDGKLRAKFTPLTTYLAFPRVIDNALVVGSQLEIRAIPLDTIFDQQPLTEKKLLLLEAKCRQGLGETKKALEIVHKLLDHFPETEAGWLLHADLCRELQLPLEEVASRCKYLALTGKEITLELRQNWGLVKRIDTNSDIQRDLQLVPGQVHRKWGISEENVIVAGTPKGSLYFINSSSLEVTDKKEFHVEIQPYLKGITLGGYLGNRQEMFLELPKAATDNAPPEWHTATGYDGPAVRWKDKFYRPRKGGLVSVYDGKKVTNIQSPLKDVGAWKIHLSPYGPIGYGDGGVFKLDENLCPVSKLIEPEKRKDYPTSKVVVHVADNAQTICALLADHPFYSLQVWTRDGKKMLRNVNLSQPVKNTKVSGSLISLNGGYLYAGSELVWVPSGRDTPPWRFGVGDNPGRSIPKIYYQHTAYFGHPLVCNNFLFVTCRDGGIYVFDLATVTK